MDGPFTLIQSSSAQSALPVLRKILTDETDPIMLFCLLYSPSSLIPEHQTNERVKVFDWTDKIPEYTQGYSPSTDMLNAVNNGTYIQPLNVNDLTQTSGASGSVTIVIDSLDTLNSDMESTSATYKLLSQIRSIPSTRLIIHTVHPPITSASSPIFPIITQTSFSSALNHIIAHPTSLLLHISTNYLCPPPPLSPPPKFWAIFIPISERHSDTDKLTFGPSGSGNSINGEELAVELLIRGGSTDHGRKKRVVERTLQGWSTAKGLCELKDLESLKILWSSSKSSTIKVTLGPFSRVTC